MPSGSNQQRQNLVSNFITELLFLLRFFFTRFTTNGINPSCSGTDTPTPSNFNNAIGNPQTLTIPDGSVQWNIQFTQCVYFQTGNDNNTVLFLGVAPNPCPKGDFWGSTATFILIFRLLPLLLNSIFFVCTDPVYRRVFGVTSVPITAPFCQCDRGTCIEESINVRTPFPFRLPSFFLLGSFLLSSSSFFFSFLIGDKGHNNGRLPM